VPEDPPIPVRFVILLELVKRGPLRASDLTEPTDLTIQGVSYNIEQLVDEGLAVYDDEDRAVRVTSEGVQALHEHFVGLKAFVDRALGEMMHIEECVALADEPLEPGDEVGLFMEAGQLHARSADSPSTGTVRKGGQPGELVTVGELTGVVDLDRGRVDLVRLPPPASLPEPTAVRETVDAIEEPGDVLVTSGLEAEVLAEQAGLAEAADVGPIPFAAEEAARSAVQRGRDVLLVAAWEDARRLSEALTSGTDEEAVDVEVHSVEAA
jgi:predicted transcriptional regulator